MLTRSLLTLVAVGFATLSAQVPAKPSQFEESVLSPHASTFGLGPRGETPVDDVSVDVRTALSTELGLSPDETQFLLNDGGKALVEFGANHRSDPRFGAIGVSYRPLAVFLRTTEVADDLVKELESATGRPVEPIVAGSSYLTFLNIWDQVAELAESYQDRLGRYPHFELGMDSRSGIVVLSVNQEDVEAFHDLADLPELTVRSVDLQPIQVASFAGATINPNATCTVGFAARFLTIFGPVNAIVTSAHCPDLSMSAYGYGLQAPSFEQCSTVDRQLQITSAPNLWFGFYLDNTWTNIAAVAGGWYNGQPFYRRGAKTQAIGTVSDPVVRSYGGGDCGSYSAYTFGLTNASWGGKSQAVVPGDSGGPLLLVYGGAYYVAGLTTGVGGGGLSGSSVWISVPPTTVACTAVDPCA